MPTPHTPHTPHTPRSTRALRTRPTRAADSAADWSCSCCGKLLGVRRSGLMHISFARGHEYLVSFPATATCRRCGTLNQASAPGR